MTFQEATKQMFAAIQAGDLVRVSGALRARAAAIKAGVTPTAEMLEEGERALRALTLLRRGLIFEVARLRQFQTGVAGTLAVPPRPRLDYRG
jgi:hypothetical protein